MKIKNISCAIRNSVVVYVISFQSRLLVLSLWTFFLCRDSVPPFNFVQFANAIHFAIISFSSFQSMVAKRVPMHINIYCNFKNETKARAHTHTWHERIFVIHRMQMHNQKWFCTVFGGRVCELWRFIDPRKKNGSTIKSRKIYTNLSLREFDCSWAFANWYRFYVWNCYLLSASDFSF